MKVRTAFTASALLLLALLVLAGCGGTENVALKYDLRAGDSFSYDMDLTLNGQVEGAGMPAGESALPKDTNVKMRLTMTVKEVTDGISTVTYSYDSLRVTTDGQAVPVPQQTMPEITLKIDETGKVLSIEGLEKALPPGLSLSKLPFDPTQFAGQTNVVYPQGGFAKPGDTWEATSMVPIPGSDQGVESKSTGKLLSVSEQDGSTVAKVEFNVNTPVDLTIDLADILKEMGLDQLMALAQGSDELAFKLTMKGAQDLKGLATIDVNKGMPVDLNADLDVKLDMNVIDAPAQVVPEDQRGPVSIDIQAKLSLKQVK